MSILGNRVLRLEDPRLLTEGGKYVDDLPLAGAAYVTYVRAPVAHARITSIDTSEAESAPGVVAVITGADVDLAPLPPSIPMFNTAMGRPFLAKDKVRFVGEPVAAVVTEERYQGEDAVEMVTVDYEPLPAVVDLEKADGHEGTLFEEAGTNVTFDVSSMLGYAPAGDFFDGCDAVVRLRIVNQRLAPCPLEVRSGAAAWEGDKLTQWVSSQNPNAFKDELVKHLGIEPGQLRIVSPDVGGGFGAKAAFYPEELLLGWIAKRIGRPVRWTETRTESMLTLGHGRGQVQYLELGGTKDGKFLAYRLVVLQDSGAYPAIGGFLPMLTRMMAPGVYDIPKVEFGGKSLVTNTCPTVAYRGAGRPEAAAAIERAVEAFSAEIGMDPAEVRRKNLPAKEAFPFTTAVQTVYDSGDYVRALDLALDASDYPALRAEQKRRREAGGSLMMGIGLSAYVEITNPLPGGEYGGVEITADGKAKVRAGTFSHGQGHATSFAMIVADRLGIGLEDVELVQGDTDEIRFGQGTMGSRSLQTAGSAVKNASDQIFERARQLTAQLLEANADDVVLDKVGGRFHVAGTPTAAKTWAELAVAATQDGGGGDGAGDGAGLRADVDFEPQGPTFPFGVHVAVVEVDADTGKVELARLITVDDSGRILNPLITEGQRHGGIAQGVAQALLEEFVYDEDGNPVTSNLADYAMISAVELPSFELVPMETPTPLNELGAKGIGESGTIGATPAVQNAVVDALSPLGVRHVDMPLTAERVWKAVQQAKAGASGAPGDDFADLMARAAKAEVPTTVDEPAEQAIDEAEGGHAKAAAAEAVQEATGEGPGAGGPMPAV